MLETCEYDGALLPRAPFSDREDECPQCAADIAEHNVRCKDCRDMCDEMQVRP
jgi:hypothetical protein